MRCCSCDVELNDEESVRKNSVTGEYEDLCSGCAGIVAADLAEDVIPSQELNFSDDFVVPSDEP